MILMATNRFSETDVVETDLDEEFEQNEDRLTLTSMRRLASHRLNRLETIFARLNFSSPILTKETHRNFQTPHLSNQSRPEIYQRTCFLLDVHVDRQIVDVLKGDHIVLCDRSLSFNDVRAMSTAIESNLKSLILQSVGLTARSMQILCQRLKECVHLNLIDLSGNKIEQNGLNFFVESLSNLPLLDFLSLVGCGIRDSSAQFVSKIFQHDQLRQLSLSHNELEENSCIAIGEALKKNPPLTHLDLSWNFIRHTASVALFRGLEKNHSLIELNLSWNGLSDEGSVALRRLLRINLTLKRLNISQCNIDWSNAKLIGEGLARNSTVDQLIIRFNPLTTTGVDHLIDGVNSDKNNVSLLDVTGTLVLSTTARSAEQIGRRRIFRMKYDGEISMQDSIGREQLRKPDSVRKLVEHLDERRWRTLDYFRVLDKKNRLELNKETIKNDLLKSGLDVKSHELEMIEQRLTRSTTENLSFKVFNHLINAQRLRDRSLSIDLRKQIENGKRRNTSILETAMPYFPEIEIVTKNEKRRSHIERLSRPKLIETFPEI